MRAITKFTNPRYKKLWSIILGCVLIISPCQSCLAIVFTTVFQCGKEIVHERGQMVNARLLLDTEIPSDAEVTKWERLAGQESSTEFENWYRKDAPIGRGVNVFIKRFDSLEQARGTFERSCRYGWRHEDWNSYNQDRLISGGELDSQYCVSPAIEWRYDTSSLCAPSGEYSSYMIFQKKDVLIAIYEYETSNPDRVGTLTNEAIQLLVKEIRGNG